MELHQYVLHLSTTTLGKLYFVGEGLLISQQEFYSAVISLSQSGSFKSFDCHLYFGIFNDMKIGKMGL